MSKRRNRHQMERRLDDLLRQRSRLIESINRSRAAADQLAASITALDAHSGNVPSETRMLGGQHIEDSRREMQSSEESLAKVDRMLAELPEELQPRVRALRGLTPHEQRDAARVGRDVARKILDSDPAAGEALRGVSPAELEAQIRDVVAAHPRLVPEDAEIVKEATRYITTSTDRVLVCDFCASPELRWRYPIKPFDDPLTQMLGGPRGRLDPDAWYACERCAHLLEDQGNDQNKDALIDIQNRDALINISAAAIHDLMAKDVECAIRPDVLRPKEILKATGLRLVAFMSNRTGGREPIGNPQISSLPGPGRTAEKACGMCGDRHVAWLFRVGQFSDGLENDLGGLWPICERCSALILRRDQAELVRQSIAASHRIYGKPTSPQVTRKQREMTVTRIEGFFRHELGVRSRVGSQEESETVPLPNIGPYSDALVEQLHIRDWWTTWQAAELLATSSGMRLHLDSKALVEGLHDVTAEGFDIAQLTRTQQELADQLNRAVTYYVSAPIAQFLNQSASSVPADAVFRPADLPAAAGFLYLAEPMDTPCAWPDGHQEHPGDPLPESATGRMLHSPEFHRVRAISWDYIPEAPAVSVVTDSRVNEPTMIVLPPDVDAVRIQVYVDSRGQSHPTFRNYFTWPEGCRADDPLNRVQWAGNGAPPEVNRDASAVVDPVRRLLLSAWTFISQQIAETADRRPNSLTRKRMREDEKRRREVDRRIRIVYLRREDRGRTVARPAEARSREYHCVWWRRPHQRHVACGPGRSERRLRWFKSQWCGPSGLSDAERARLPVKASRAIYAVIK